MTRGRRAGAPGNRPRRRSRRGGTIAPWSSGQLHVASGYRGAEQGAHAADDRSSRGPLDVQIAAAAVLLVAALIGALAGSAGYALLVERHQNRRVAKLAERLARAADEGSLVAHRGRTDRRPAPAPGLRPARRPGRGHVEPRDGRPADRDRQPPGRPRPPRRGAGAGDPLPPPAVGHPRRPRPLQAPQRRPRPRGRRRASCGTSAQLLAAQRPRRRRRRPLRRRGVPGRPARDRTPTPPRRSPRSCAASSAAARCGCRTASVVHA